MTGARAVLVCRLASKKQSRRARVRIIAALVAGRLNLGSVGKPNLAKARRRLLGYR